jgi:hypothetical protein
MKSQPDLHAGTWAYRAVAVGCVFLIALTGLVSAVHIHPDGSGVPDHSCSVCALANAGVTPAEIASPLPALVRSLVTQTFSPTAHALVLVSSQFIRPPPLG